MRKSKLYEIYTGNESNLIKTGKNDLTLDLHSNKYDMFKLNYLYNHIDIPSIIGSLTMKAAEKLIPTAMRVLENKGSSGHAQKAINKEVAKTDLYKCLGEKVNEFGYARNIENDGLFNVVFENAKTYGDIDKVLDKDINHGVRCMIGDMYGNYTLSKIKYSDISIDKIDAYVDANYRYLYDTEKEEMVYILEEIINNELYNLFVHYSNEIRENEKDVGENVHASLYKPSSSLGRLDRMKSYETILKHIAGIDIKPYNLKLPI